MNNTGRTGSGLSDLFFRNPMLIEVKRFWRKFFYVGKSRGANITASIIALIAYAILLGIAAVYREGFDGGLVITLQTFLFCLLVPSMLSGSIAGEREKRTWDLLAVAPITKDQIVIGKFISALISILIVAGLLFVLVLVGDNQEIYERGGSILAAEMVSIGWAVCLAGLSILVSAGSARTFSAQAGIYGLQVLGLIIWPTMAGVLASGSRSGFDSMDVYMYLHPFYAVFKALTPGSGFSSSNGDLDGSIFAGWGHMIGYGFIACMFLMWAITKLKTGRDR